MSPIPYQQRLNPYIQRMVEDMQVRNLSPEPSMPTPTTSISSAATSANPPSSSGPKRFINTRSIWSMRRKSRGVPSTKRFVAYVFSTR